MSDEHKGAAEALAAVDTALWEAAALVRDMYQALADQNGEHAGAEHALKWLAGKETK